MTQDIFAHLESNFPSDLRAVCQFLQQRSISYTGEGIAETADMVRAMIAELGGSAEVIPTAGHPLVYGRLDQGAKHTLLYYSMYDTMPADKPGWTADPFGAEIVDVPPYGPCVIARGAANTKGPTAGFFRALRAFLTVRGKLPVNFVFCVEGEEEMGSRAFNKFVPAHKEKFAGAEAALFAFFSRDTSLQTFMWLGMKGMLYFELKCRGGDWGGPRSRGVHGAFAGWVANPAWRLVRALATMTGENDSIQVAGLAEGALPLSPSELKVMQENADLFDEHVYMQANDVARLKWPGSGLQLFEKLYSEPSLNINGIWSGYTGPGTKTLLPHEATAKVDVRLVPRMDPDKVVAAIRKHLDDHGYPDIEMNVLNKYYWSRSSIDEPVIQAMLTTYAQMGQRCQVQPTSPGSAPYWAFEQVLGIPYVTGGLGHGSRQHSSNEYLTVDGLLEFEKSMVLFLENYVRAVS